jgi:predicted DNA-binding WGR domain protein
MASDTPCLVLERRDPTRNIARFYTLSVHTCLFGGATLVRQWGRIGMPGRCRIELHDTAETASQALNRWLRRKQARGYQIRPIGNLG